MLCGWHLMHPSWPRWWIEQDMWHWSLGQSGVPICIWAQNLNACHGIWASSIIQEAVRICKEYITRHLSKEYRLPKRADNSFESDYSPKLDVSPVLGPEQASYYQFLIWVMRWMIKIGRIDINTEVSLLSSYSAMPRQWHLEAAWLIMGYLKLRHNSRFVFNPS